MATGRRELVEVTYRELLPGDRDGHLMKRKVTQRPRQLPGGRVELVMEWSNGKPDRATPLASRRVKVMRVVAGPGMALRDRRKARATGGTVEVWDTEHVDSQVTPDQVRGLRWAMRCEHGTVVGRRTFDEAMDDVKDPRRWCGDCAPASVGPGVMTLPLL